MDAIEFVAFVSAIEIPDDKIADMSEDNESEMIAEIGDDELLDCLRSLREAVKMAREIQAEESV